jgi:16S rRNA G966 N2-methylase RsmD
LANNAILSAIKKGYIADKAVFIVEMSSKSIEPVNVPELTLDDERKYGDTIIHIYTYQRSAA